MKTKIASSTFWVRKVLAKFQIVLAAVLLPWAASATNLEGRYATIVLDGSLSDWQPSDTFYSASEITVGAPIESTITNILVANDATNIYIALQLPAAASITNAWTYNVFVDSDASSTSGFNGGWMTAGYDRLVQYGQSGGAYSVHEFSGGANQSGWSWNFNTLISYSYADNIIEWAIPMNALGISGNKLRIEFNVTDGGVTTETWAYQWESGVSTYTLAAPPTTAPIIEAVEAAPDQVQVTFSRAVDATTAVVAGNYAIDGGLSVISASLHGTDQKKVILTTGAQTRGNIYLLTVNGVKASNGVAIAPNSTKAFISSIILDGSTADWDGIAALYSNPQGSPTAVNFKDVYAYNDASYIYFRLTLWEPAQFLTAQNNLLVNTDNDPGSGNIFWGGSELMVQGTMGYQQKNGGWNEGAINGLDHLCLNTGETNYEFRISRAATYASDNLPVFTADAISFAFDGEVEYTTVNRLPAEGGTVPYNLVPAPVVPPGPLMISGSGGQATLVWTGPGMLQTRDSLSGGSWVDLPAASSPFTTNSTGQLYFRLKK